MLGFAPLGGMPVAGFPSNVYTLSITETGSISDAESIFNITFLGTIIETGNASDTTDTTVTLGPNHKGNRARFNPWL